MRLPNPRSCLPALLLLCLLPLPLPLPLPLALASPFSPVDNFSPACNGTLLADPPPGGWQNWSDAATWKNGVVPGVGSLTGVNVTIPCGQAVLLDLPSVSLNVLEVQGALKVLDDPALPQINISAALVLVKGRLVIGSHDQQFRQRVAVQLIPNPNGRANFSFTDPPPADPLNPRVVGHKAFAVVGGQVDLHGLPGPAHTASWTKLVRSASVNDTSIQVAGDVSDWPVGAPIVLASTDYGYDQDDVRHITGVSCTEGQNCTISLDAGLEYNHFGDPLGVPDGFGGYIDETGEVALLQRNIVIFGTDEPAPHKLEGGHFIVFMTNKRQIIEGVEFRQMGQQGHLGRYPLHFHLCGNQANNSVIRKNLVMHSKQRCVVIHVTFNALVDSNVAYNTSGHCFMIEEGSETGNTFVNNLGMRTLVPNVTISSDETDNSPATFWITNPNNSYIDNAAAGSQSNAFWPEFRTHVRGLSLLIPALSDVQPVYVTALGNFSGNSAHSSKLGIRFYTHGYNPGGAVYGNSNPKGYALQQWPTFGPITIWKTQRGALIHQTGQIVLSGWSFADNVEGLSLSAVQGVNATGHRYVGLSSNTGNPTGCQKANGAKTCMPVTGCRFPLAAGEVGRSAPGQYANHSIYGITLSSDYDSEDGKSSNFVSNTTFSAFDNTCLEAAGIGVVVTGTFDFWNDGAGLQSLRFDKNTPTNPIYLPSEFSQQGDRPPIYFGDTANYIAVRDLDGSIIGGAGGYVIANNPAMLPPASSSSNCTFLPQANAYGCPGLCYRTVQLVYDEPSFFPTNQSVEGARALGEYSFWNVTRTVDGSSFAVAGNLLQPTAIQGYANTTRTFAMSLLAEYTYELSFNPGTNNSFVPQNVTVVYRDGEGCGQPVTLAFRASAQDGRLLFWTLLPSGSASWAPCPGNSAYLNASVAPAVASPACSPIASPPVPVLELTLSAALPSYVPVIIVPTQPSSIACNISEAPEVCGLVAVGSFWAFNASEVAQDNGTQSNQSSYEATKSGKNSYSGSSSAQSGLNSFTSRREALALLSAYTNDSSQALIGQGIFSSTPSKENYGDASIATLLLQPKVSKLTTYVFETSFNVTWASCLSSLELHVLVQDGVLVLLNGFEILRTNLPPGNITSSTLALSPVDLQPVGVKYSRAFNFTPYSVALPAVGGPLHEGLNNMRALVHVSSTSQSRVSFALAMAAGAQVLCQRRVHRSRGHSRRKRYRRRAPSPKKRKHHRRWRKPEG